MLAFTVPSFHNSTQKREFSWGLLSGNCCREFAGRILRENSLGEQFLSGKLLLGETLLHQLPAGVKSFVKLRKAF